ncbi:MAG: HAMP domain-containing histidine kinase, partial [Campylobacter sp.]|nr:HAMP domain-containing histidine kinase [Campylobacter sp.]
MKKQAIINDEVKNLKEIKMGIYMKATMDGLNAIKPFMDEKGVDGCIFSENKNIIFQNTECEINLDKASFLLEGRVGIFEALQNMQKGDNELSKANIFLIGKNIEKDLNSLKLKILFEFIISLIAIMLIAFYLAKLALQPLYDKISTLNRFIKDSTHEINTPLSIIMMSIETINKSEFNAKNLKRINNIELAAKTLSRIYENLVFLSFKNKNPKKENINLKNIINERISYFTPFFTKKQLKLNKNLQNSFINANSYEITTMIDNLLSNAVKYSNPHGLIEINLIENEFSITNDGEEIPPELQEKIFERYARFNKDQGGFGIGLSLVKEVCKNNGILIICHSEENKKTSFILKW